MALKGKTVCLSSLSVPSPLLNSWGWAAVLVCQPAACRHLWGCASLLSLHRPCLPQQQQWSIWRKCEVQISWSILSPKKMSQLTVPFNKSCHAGWQKCSWQATCSSWVHLLLLLVVLGENLQKGWSVAAKCVLTCLPPLHVASWRRRKSQKQQRIYHQAPWFSFPLENRASYWQKTGAAIFLPNLNMFNVLSRYLRIQYMICKCLSSRRSNIFSWSW